MGHYRRFALRGQESNRRVHLARVQLQRRMVGPATFFKEIEKLFFAPQLPERFDRIRPVSLTVVIAEEKQISHLPLSDDLSAQ
jgi:hypothetical protein